MQSDTHDPAADLFAVRPYISAPGDQRKDEIAGFNNRLTRLAIICPRVSLAVAKVFANPGVASDDMMRTVGSEIEIMVRNLGLGLRELSCWFFSRISRQI